MKALVYTGPETVVLRDVAKPEVKEGQALVKVKYCGLCGGDMGVFAGTHPRAKPPLIQGHEFVGIIDELAGSSKFHVGDRVTCYPLRSCGHCISCRNGIPHICQTLKLAGIDYDGGFAEYVLVDQSQLIALPDAISFEAAALIEPLAIVTRAVHQAAYRYLDTTLVMGAGPIGILNAMALKDCGASRIIISDLTESRLRLCGELGFETVNITDTDLEKYVAETTNGDGLDIVFECSGTEPATFQATRLAKMEGCVCMTGIHKKPHVSNLPEFSFKEQRIVSTRVYTREEFERSVGLAVKLEADLKKLISHVIPLSDAETMYDIARNPDAVSVKILLNCEQ